VEAADATTASPIRAYVALLDGCVLGSAASASSTTTSGNGRLQLQLQQLWQVAPMGVSLGPVQVTAQHSSSSVPIFSTPVLVEEPMQPSAAAGHVRPTGSNQQDASGAAPPGAAGISDSNSCDHGLAATPHAGMGHLLLVAGVDGQVAAMKTQDGQLVWRVHLGSHIFADLAALPPAPGAAADVPFSAGAGSWQQVLAATQNGEVIALDASNGTQVGVGAVCSPAA
jgi:hypothetical protein